MLNIPLSAGSKPSGARGVMTTTTSLYEPGMTGHTHFSFTLSKPGLVKQACVVMESDFMRLVLAGRVGSYKNTVICTVRPHGQGGKGWGGGHNRDAECGSMVEVYKVITLI